MKSSLEVSGNIIIRRFSGSVTAEDMVNSWKEIFSTYPDLSEYRGIITTFDGAVITGGPGEGVKEMVKVLNEHKEQLSGLRVAIVLDHPMVTNAVMVGHYIKNLNVQPFVTEEAAMRWVNP